MAASKKTKKKTTEPEKEPREFFFEVNRKCPYKADNCGVRLPCLPCTYDWMISIEDYKNADKLYVQFEEYVAPHVTRHSILHDNLQREIVDDPPTETQLQIIKSLTKDDLKPKNKTEAKELIKRLRKG